MADQETPSTLGAAAAAETAATAASGVDKDTTKPATTGAEQKPAVGADGKPVEQKPAGAPEKYEAFKLPDGFKADDAVMTEFQGLAKEAGLPQATAQKLVDLHARMADANAKASGKAWDDLHNSWKDQARADKEIGGSNFDQSIQHAKSALKAFGTPELVKALDATGAGSHPEIIRAFARVGKAIAEDKLHMGGTAAGTAAKTAEDLFYTKSAQRVA